MNQNKSLIEAARLKKKAQEDDKVIKQQVELIKEKTSIHRRSTKIAMMSSAGSKFKGG